MLRFYLDENLQIVIADQLRRRSIEVVTVRDLGRLGDDDISHLERATAMGYVLCTCDPDFVDLASSGVEHVGIVKGIAQKHSVGDWVKKLILLNATLTPEEMENLVEFV